MMIILLIQSFAIGWLLVEGWIHHQHIRALCRAIVTLIDLVNKQREDESLDALREIMDRPDWRDRR